MSATNLTPFKTTGMLYHIKIKVYFKSNIVATFPQLASPFNRWRRDNIKLFADKQAEDEWQQHTWAQGNTPVELIE